MTIEARYGVPTVAVHTDKFERVVRSVANLTRSDGEELLRIAPQVRIKTEVVPFPLEEANTALEWLREGKIKGAAVLKIS